MRELNGYSVIGFVLSVVGAALDFLSGFPVIQGQTMYSTQSYMVMRFDPAALTIPLYALGIILLVTGVLGLTSIGMRNMQLFGGLMVIYGVIMLGIGWLMYSSAGMTFASMTLSSIGMLIVGVLMIANGVAMAYRKSTIMPKS